MNLQDRSDIVSSIVLLTVVLFGTLTTTAAVCSQTTVSGPGLSLLQIQPTVLQTRWQNSDEVLNMQVKPLQLGADPLSVALSRQADKTWELTHYLPLCVLAVVGGALLLLQWLQGSSTLSDEQDVVQTEGGIMNVGSFLMLSVGFLTLTIGNDFAVSSASVRSGGQLPASPAHLVCLAESAKVLVSALLWATKGFPVLCELTANPSTTSGSGGKTTNYCHSFIAVIGTASVTVLCMLLPAIVYLLNNMISLFALSRIQIAHLAVLRPTGIAAFNCVLWLAFFGRRHLPTFYAGLPQKVFGILLCVCAGLVNTYDFTEQVPLLRLETSLIVLASTFLSAFGAVTNEFVQKHRMQLGLDLQNLILYTLTLSLTLAVLAATGDSLNLVELLSNPAVRVIVVYNAAMGLVVSRLLKHMGSISKMILCIIREPIEVVAAPVFVVSEMSYSIFFSASLALVGALLYFLPQSTLRRLAGIQSTSKGKGEPALC